MTFLWRDIKIEIRHGTDLTEILLAVGISGYRELLQKLPDMPEGFKAEGEISSFNSTTCDIRTV